MTSEHSPFDMFQWLPTNAQVAFESEARTRHYTTGETVYAQGEPGDQMFRVVSGSVRLSIARSDGRELLYMIFEPGDCFGVSSCIDGEVRPHTAEAGSPSQIQVVTAAAFERLRADHQSFNDALLRLVTRHMRLLSMIFGDSQLNDLTGRVAGRIASAARAFGVQSSDRKAISVRISQSELALMVGASRQSVNKVLQQFQDRGIISIEYRALLIHQLEELRLIANAHPQLSAS